MGRAAMTELGVARSLAVDAAEAAGALMRWPGRADTGMRVKDSSGDVVTDLDLAAEKVIIDRIRAVFPAHRIIAEEAGLLDPDVPGGSPASGAAGGRTWLVEPL